MKSLVKYTSYNQIIREFDVYIMLVNNEYKIKLVKRFDGDKPPKLTLDSLNKKIEHLDKKIDKLAEIVQQGFVAINARLDAIVKANNLIDPTQK